MKILYLFIFRVLSIPVLLTNVHPSPRKLKLAKSQFYNEKSKKPRDLSLYDISNTVYTQISENDLKVNSQNFDKNSMNYSIKNENDRELQLKVNKTRTGFNLSLNSGEKKTPERKLSVQTKYYFMNEINHFLMNNFKSFKSLPRKLSSEFKVWDKGIDEY